MRAAAEGFARRWWAGELGARGRLLTGLTMPLSWAWKGASALALAHRAARSERVTGLVVVSVGNLAVGGTGKTPLVEWATRRLQSGGHRPAVLVGGHAHDEAALLAGRLSDVVVVEDRDRVAGARRALAEGATVAIVDDGFQHVRLARDLDVVLLAAEDRFPSPVLPSGPYREGVGALFRADVALVTRRSAGPEEGRALADRVERVVPGLVAGGVELSPGGWASLDGRPAEPPDGDLLAVCGVGRPAAFRATVARMVRGSVELVAFSDHHTYTPADIDGLRRRARGRPLVTTDKDAVKLRAHAGTLGETYVLAEEVRWDWGEDAFLDRLGAVARRPGHR